jgi:hypothetical protein
MRTLYTSFLVASLSALTLIPSAHAEEKAASPKSSDSSPDKAPSEPPAEGAQAPATSESPPADSPEAKAATLFEQGRTLMEVEYYPQACEKFEESLRITEGVGTKFNLAACYEKIDKKLEARRLYLEVVTVTRQAGQTARAEAAEERVKALEAELGVLKFEVNDKSSDLKIQMGPQELSASDLAAPLFVDPGEYEISASASDKETWTDEIDVRASETLTVEIPELKAPKPEPEPEPEPEDSGFEESEPQSESGTWIPPVALGVGAIGLLSGLAFTQQYRSSNQDAKDTCPSSYACTPEEIDRHEELLSDARRARTGAYISYGVAAAGLIGGVLYYVLRPSASNKQAAHKTLSISPAIGSDSLGGAVHGSF